MNRTRFRLGTDFPHEGFVQQAIEHHFLSSGFRHVERDSAADLICVHPETAERWVVEAKGETNDTGLDFRTGLGQLLQQMQSESTLYGLAIPDTPKFRRQCKRVSPFVRRVLNLHWVMVDKAGGITVVGPDASLGDG